MAYTTINKSTDYFNTKLYAGTGSSLALTGVGHQPDLVWIKERSGATNHFLHDAVRGATKSLFPNLNVAEDTNAQYLTAFGTDGFTVGTNGGINTNGNNYLSWNWKAGGGQGSSNTDGSINTTYTSVNTTAGFSISKYTGNNTANATVGHGLGVAPEVVIIKRLDSSGSWISKFNSNTDGYMYLHADDAMSSSSGWLPTSSTTFTLANQWTAYNASGGTYIAYCFAPKTGFSKFGEYIGNGNSDGNFLYCGFAPAWVVCKSIDTTSHWNCFDNKRSTFNPVNDYHKLNEATAEDTNVSDIQFDFLSNGLKIRGNNDEYNGSGEKYIYMAFAEAPLVGSNNIPCTAR